MTILYIGVTMDHRGEVVWTTIGAKTTTKVGTAQMERASGQGSLLTAPLQTFLCN